MKIEMYRQPMHFFNQVPFQGLYTASPFRRPCPQFAISTAVYRFAGVQDPGLIVDTLDAKDYNHLKSWPAGSGSAI